MTVCFFGIYKPDYSRNRVLIRGLKENGVKVIECNAKNEGGICKYLILIKKHWQIRKKYNAMIVGFPGYHTVILAKLLTRKKIILDIFFSIYDSEVWDRENINPRSLKAGYYWILDWIACRLADKILLDTNTHIDYFIKTFKAKKGKFVRIFVGSDDKTIRPMQAKEEVNKNYFLVHFHGIATPLQGTKYILQAANLLKNENIKFNIIGIKRRDPILSVIHKNVNFINYVPYEKLKNYIAKADICLGIFGDTKKAERVIPNKVYEALACRKPVISGDSRAIKELLTHKKNCFLCKLANPADLAQAILILKNNTELRNGIANNGYSLFKECLLPKKLTKKLVNYLNYVDL